MDNRYKIVFLDIDGVLNCSETKETVDGYIGIDHNLVKNLKELVDETNAIIVLTSTWKKRWFKNPQLKRFQDNFANALELALSQYGLQVFDKTKEEIYGRGSVIIDYLDDFISKGNEIESIVILDDMPFDYEELKMTEFLVETGFEEGGFTIEALEEAKEVLRHRF